MGIVQYISYFLGGHFLLFVMGAYLTVSAGVSSLGVLMIFAPMMIGWLFTGLSLFFPRISAGAVLALSLPFLGVGIAGVINTSPGSEPWVLIVPAVLLLVISIAAILKPQPSVWARARWRWTKVLVLSFAFAPLIWGIVALIRFFSNVTFVR